MIFTPTNLKRLARLQAGVVSALATVMVAGCASAPPNQAVNGGVEAAAIQRDGRRLFTGEAAEAHNTALGEVTAAGIAHPAEGGQP